MLFINDWPWTFYCLFGDTVSFSAPEAMVRVVQIPFRLYVRHQLPAGMTLTQSNLSLPKNIAPVQGMACNDLSDHQLACRVVEHPFSSLLTFPHTVTHPRPSSQISDHNYTAHVGRLRWTASPSLCWRATNGCIFSTNSQLLFSRRPNLV
jgi:hypothetical protein